MKKLFMILIVAMMATVNASGQTTNEPKESKPYIEVTGTAELEIIPDEIYVSIIIRERYSGRDKISIETQEDSLKSALKRIGVDIANLSLSDANADYVKVKWVKKDVLTKKDYSLKVTNATTVGQVFQQLDKLEIDDAYISKVNHSKIDSLDEAVRIMAIKAAKEKADYLLSTIGEQTGKPIVIEERNIDNPQNHEMLNELRYISVGAKSKSDAEVQFKKIKVLSIIYVRFLIK